MPTFGSLFAGIGGLDLGLERAGWECKWQVEIDGACSRVLRRRWPNVPNLGDVHDISAATASRVDVLPGGFPCQDLSVAGRRAGLAGERSGLFYEFARIVSEIAPRWVLIENVPGLLSSNEGRDMGVVLGTLGELGYGWAYRVLDAQFFGVAQRRRRVFIIGCFGDGRRAAQVLFESESCEGHSAPSREQRAEPAGPLGGGAYGTGRRSEDDPNLVAATLNSGGNNGGFRTEPGEPLVAQPLRANRWGGSDSHGDEGNVVLAYGPSENQRGEVLLNEEHTRQITAGGGKPGQRYPAVAFTHSGYSNKPAWITGDRTDALPAAGQHPSSHQGIGIVDPTLMVRRLTPLECERLQGFPDGWTEGETDSARYRMLGNAVCVSVAEWIGRRLMRAA